MSTASTWLLRAAVAVARALGVTLLVVVALAVGLSTQSSTPAFRRLVVGRVNRALQGAFRGQVEVTSVGRLSWRWVEGVSGVVRDAQGRTVLHIERSRARLDTPALVWSWLTRKDVLPVSLRIRAGLLEATLVAGPDGQPTLVHAFEPLSPPRGGGPRVRVELGEVRVDRLVVRGMIPGELQAKASARGVFSSEEDRSAVVAIDGSLGEVPFRARGAMAGRTFDARVDVDEATPAALGLATREALRLHARVRGTIPVLWVSAELEQVRGGRADVEATVFAKGEPVVAGDVVVRGLDPSSFTPSWPRGSFGAHAHLLAHGTTALVSARSDPTTVGSLAVPALDAFAAYDRGRADLALRAHPPTRWRLREGTDIEGAELSATAEMDVPRGTTEGHVEARFAAARVGSLRLGRSSLEGRWKGPAPSPEVHVSARAEGVALGGRSLQVTLDLDGRKSGRDGATGQAIARFDASGCRCRGEATLALSGRALTGRFSAELDDASLSGTLANGSVQGPIDRLESWSRSTGVLEAQSTVPLPSLTRWFPQLPLKPTEGTLSVGARVERSAAAVLPRATLDVSTHGLVLGSAWQVRGVELGLHASVEGGSGTTEVQGELRDGTGPLLRGRIGGRVPIGRLLEAPAQWSQLFQKVPAEASLELPSRQITSLPAQVIPAALRGLHGQLEASLTASGTVRDPHVAFQVTGNGIAPGHDLAGGPFDTRLDGAYDGRVASARATVSRAQEHLLDAQAEANFPVESLLQPSTAQWDARAELGLHEFPLDSIPALAGRRLGGVASGQVKVEGLHRDARAEASLRLDKLKMGRVCFASGEATLRFDGARLEATASLGTPGSLARLALQAPARWGASLLPSFDPKQPIDATLTADGFRAAALMPFLRGPVSRLDGRIDASAHAVFAPDLATGNFTGDIRLSQAVLEIPLLGEQLENVNARLSVGPWGTVHLDDVSASSGAGRATASARATFAGAELRTATFDLDVPSDKRLPVTVSGVPIGEASGHVHADGTMSGDGTTLDTKVVATKVEVMLPPTSGHSLQALDPAANVSIGARTTSGRFVLLPTGPPAEAPAHAGVKVHASIDLGELRIRRDVSVDILVHGQPFVDLDGKTRVHGVVDLVRGKVEVFGKRFTLEPSTVAFTGDAENPQLHATAKYDAPDKTNIFVDVAGTPNRLKLTLRSEPPRSQDEIFGLLLFGSETGLGGASPADQQPGAAQRAAGLASGVLTQGLNEALSGISGLQIATRVDTSQASNPRPMVEVRLSSNVVTRVTVQTGLPAPGEPRDLTLVTFDWRFHPRWSLQTTVGDAGSTAIEVLWRHRY
jgi:translocation and assembly module TamB